MPSKKKAVAAPSTKRAPVTIEQPKAAPSSKSTALVSWREQAKAAVVHRKAEQAKLSVGGGNYISFKGGVTSIGGIKQKNPLPVVILASSFQRAYYTDAYQPDVAATPGCFSFDKMAPHPEAPVPQADRCAVCRQNEFGSADNGKGKACKEGMRIAIIPLDVLNDVERLKSVEIVTGTLSYLNSQNFRNFAAATYGDDPEWFFATNINNEPDSKSQYALSFEAALIDDKLDDEAMQVLSQRAEEARALLAAPYVPIEAKAPAANPARRRKF